MDLDKFKGMPFKKKIEWIVHYYGIWIIVSIVGICVAVSFAKSVFFPKPLPDVCAIILSDDYLLDDIPLMESEIGEAFGGTCQIEIYNESDVYGNSAFSIKLMSNQVDLVIAPKSAIDSMNETGYLESSEKLGDRNLYIAIPARARKSEALDAAIDYFKNR